MTAEWNVGMEIEVLIDPHHSGIKPTCNGVQWLRICTPNGGSKAIWSSHLSRTSVEQLTCSMQLLGTRSDAF
ncbi:MAG: hypothetical protein QOE55_8632 [Acidobacteriaceae bacterium]|nr:hypothetical protein [Acidobacteriaceae bacterium]MDX6464935.1 hypothetical protein [Acidobacteriaceae bacterium]